MKSARFVLVLTGLTSMFAVAQASACDVLDREIVAVKAEKIAGYTEAGKFDRDLQGAEILKKRIAACSEVNSALAKVVLNEQASIWIDLTEVKLTAPSCEEPAQAPEGSKLVKVPSRSKDTTVVGVSGIGGDGSCK